jgi:hypothetical protein
MRPSTRCSCLALAVLLTAGCSVDGALGPGPALELARAERRWERQDLVDYDYRYQRGCFCPDRGPLRVRVRAGAVVSATRLDDGSALSASELAEVPTIPGLFEIARGALADADAVEVAYHPAFGFPTRISIDWYEHAADDEVYYTAGSLDPAP